MGVTLLPREKTALKEVSTTDMEAYDLCLRGRELANRGPDRQVVEEAVRMFQALLARYAITP